MDGIFPITTLTCLFFSDVVSAVGVSVVDAATQSSQVGVAPCHNLLEEVRRDNQQL